MILILFIFALVAFYFYATRNYSYWSKRNVKHDRPLPLFGTYLRNFVGLKSFTELSVELYNKYPEEKFVGYYQGPTPGLIVKDLELAKHVLNVDFSKFYFRGFGRNPDVEFLNQSLFHIEGDRWRLLRQRLTPTFTTAKLKQMFPLIVNCAEKLKEVGNGIVAKGGDCDVRELMARFTTEFIGACGFGIEMNSINNENSQFRDLGKKMFKSDLRKVILLTLCELFPGLENYVHATSYEVENSILNLVKQIVNSRQGKPIGRNDFVDLLLEFHMKDKIVGESFEKVGADGKPETVEMEMDIKCMAAQVFVFFGAGFETSSSATSYMLHELAFHPETQQRVQENIDSVLQKYDNKLCYDAIAEMTYLDMAFKESMRMFPSLGVLNRTCTRKYTFPGTDVTIDPGVRVIIPIQAIQTDERYFENPTEFIPERFDSETSKKIQKYAYLPFGEGPRSCIGARLGQMQSLAGLASLLSKFSVEPCAATKRQLEINHLSNIVQGVVGGIPLRLKLREKKN